MLRTGEIPQLTGLRFVAAVWVLLHHFSFLPGDLLARWAEPLAPLVSAGRLGVDLFFVLSGLVLARTYLERWAGTPRPRQLLAYLRARLLRIWPLYAVVVVLFGIWCLARARFGHDGVVTWQDRQPGLGPGSWLAQLTMTQQWSSSDLEGHSFVLPTWSISAEWLAYLVFPLLALVVWRLRRWPRPVLAVLAVVAASPVALAAVVVGGAIGAAGIDDGVWLWALRVGGGFTAGVLTWLVVRRLPATPTVARWAQRAVVAVLAEIAVVAYWAATAPPSAAIGPAGRLFLVVPLFPVLLGGLCLSDRGPARWLAGARMQHGGRISYALYLVHFPLVEITLVAMTRFPALAPGGSAAALLVPHVAVAALLLAHLAHRWIEVPVARWGRGRASGPGDPGGPVVPVVGVVGAGNPPGAPSPRRPSSPSSAAQALPATGPIDVVAVRR